MRLLAVSALILSAVLSIAPAVAKPSAKPAPVPPIAVSKLPIQDIPEDELDGILIGMRNIANRDAPDDPSEKPYPEALLTNNSRFIITSLTLRLLIRDKTYKDAYSDTFTVTKFDPPSPGVKGGRLLPACQSWVRGASFTPPPGLLTTNYGGYWMIMVSAQGRPCVINEATPQETLAAACSLGDLADVKSVLAAHPDLINGPPPSRAAEPPLSWAAAHDHVVVTRFLLSQGAKIEIRDSEGLTPLYKAVNDQNPLIVHLLLAHHADLMAKDKDGVTCLQKAHDNLVLRGAAGWINQMMTDASQGKWPKDDTD